MYDYHLQEMERRNQFYSDLNNYRREHRYSFFDFDKFRPLELKALRYLRGEKPHDFFKRIGVAGEYENPDRYEYVPKEIAEKYVFGLNVIPSEYQRIQVLIDGGIEKYEQSRQIPKVIRERVMERDNRQCTVCGKKEKLHLHHIKPFSEGGLHHEDNLVVLCPPCHTDVHEGDRSYHVMKKAFGEE